MTEKQMINYITNEQKHWNNNPQLKGSPQLADEFFDFDNKLADYDNDHDTDLSDQFRGDDEINDGEDMMDFLKSWDSPTYHVAVYTGISKIDNIRALYTAWSDTPADVDLTEPSNLADRCDDALDELE